MRRRHTTDIRAAIGIVTGLIGALLVIVAAPSVAQAASFTSIPDRLYMVPQGGTSALPGGIPSVISDALLGLKTGTLPFDGTDDLIVGEKREIKVVATEGPNDCLLKDEAPGTTDYDIDDCTRLGLVAYGGRIRLGPSSTVFRDYTSDPDSGGPLGLNSDDPTEFVWRFPDGAVLDAWGGGGPNTDAGESGATDTGNPNDAGGYLNLQINGDTDMLNKVLETLVFVPPADYHYHGESPAPSITVTLTGGDGVNPPSSPHKIDIRVLSVNQFPEHGGPSAFNAPAATEVIVPGPFTVIDEDNDEDVDGAEAEADPSEPEETYIDGENDEMLFVAYLDCPSTPLAPNTGVHFASASFAPVVGTLKEFLEDRLAPSGVGPFVTAGLDALAAINPDIADATIQTADETSWTTLFAGVGTMSAVRDALSTVTFRHDVPEETCTLYTIVSDLGNNGLPVQWFVDPLPDGFEIPMIGFDWNELDITTGVLQAVDISFDSSAAIFVTEGDDAIAPLIVTPQEHPAFTIHWDALPRNGDPIAPGEATPNSDFGGTYDNTLDVPMNAGTIPYPDAPDTAIYNDTDPEPTEAFKFKLIIVPDDYPDGWIIESDTPTRTVVIKDDDGGPGSGAITAAVGATSITEGDTGTTNMEFTINLTGAPASGYETIEYEVTAGTATTGVDFTPITGTATFAPNATMTTVMVPVIGDYHVEADETVTIDLSEPAGLTLTGTSATGTITNDDDPSVVSILPTSIAEGATGPITISMTNPTGHTCTANISTSDISADAGDYTALVNAPVTLAGVTTNTIDLVTAADADGVDETLSADFILNLNNDCVYGTHPATITITEPPPPGTITATVAAVAVIEGNTATTNMDFVVTLSEPALGGETIDYATANGTATTADNDYTNTSGSHTFDIGDTEYTITVPINGDYRVEGDETVTLTVSNATGLTLTPNPATAAGTITNDDDPSVVSILPTSIAEGATGPITISMTNHTGHTCTANITTTNGSAEVGDYTSLSNAPLTLNGVASVTIDLITVADADSDNETVIADFILNLNDDCVYGTHPATITITEPPSGDPPPLTIDVPDDIVRPNDPGQPGAVVTWPAVTAAGGTPPLTITCSHDSGDFFPLGPPTTVNCNVTDSEPEELQAGEPLVAASLTAAATFTVTVIDLEPPVIDDLPDLVRTTPGNPIVVTFPLPGATDNSGVPPTVACTAPSGSLFAVGVATVTCTATDGAGNQASSSFTITVNSDGSSPPTTTPTATPSGPLPSPIDNLPETGGSPMSLLVVGAAFVMVGLLLGKRRRPAA